MELSATKELSLSRYIFVLTLLVLKVDNCSSVVRLSRALYSFQWFIRGEEDGGRRVGIKGYKGQGGQGGEGSITSRIT